MSQKEKKAGNSMLESRKEIYNLATYGNNDRDIVMYEDKLFIFKLISPYSTGKTTMIPRILLMESSNSSTLLASINPSSAKLNSSSFNIMTDILQDMSPDSEGFFSSYILSGRDKGQLLDTKRKVLFSTLTVVKDLLLELISIANKDREIQTDNLLFSFSHIILDEIHMMTIEHTVIIGIYNYVHLENKSLAKVLPRLVLIGARDVDFSYLQIPTISLIMDKKSNYEVKEIYSKEDYDINKGKRYVNMVEDIISVHRKDKNLNRDMMVFLHGAAEIRKMANAIKDEKIKDLKVISVLGKFDEKELEMIEGDRQKGNRGFRFVIITTSLLETSITIPSIYYVFDSMLMKRQRKTLTGGYKNTVVTVTKDVANQRKWRTGRVDNGVVYRYIRFDSYKLLKKNEPTEISKLPIHKDVINIILADMKPQQILNPGNDEFLTKKINETIGDLELLGLKYSTGTKITELGITVSKMSSSIRRSTIMFYWGLSNKTNGGKRYDHFTGILISAILDLEPQKLFDWPMKKRDKDGKVCRLDGPAADDLEERKRVFFERFAILPRNKEFFTSPFLTCLNVFNKLNRETDMALFKMSSSSVTAKEVRELGKRVQDWCSDNNINYNTVHEIRNAVVEDISVYEYHILKRQGRVSIKNFDPIEVYKDFIEVAGLIYPDRLLMKEKREDRKIRYIRKGKGQTSKIYEPAFESVPGRYFYTNSIYVISEFEVKDRFVINLWVPTVFASTRKENPQSRSNVNIINVDETNMMDDLPEIEEVRIEPEIRADRVVMTEEELEDLFRPLPEDQPLAIDQNTKRVEIGYIYSLEPYKIGFARGKLRK